MKPYTIVYSVYADDENRVFSYTDYDHVMTDNLPALLEEYPTRDFAFYGHSVEFEE